LQYPIWVGAVGEAIYTLGAERNGDIVIGASYAPGFQNLNDFQWAVSLLDIWITVHMIRHVTLTCFVA